MTVDDLDALLAPAAWDPRRCTVDQALSQVDDAGRRAKMEAAARDPRVPQGRIVEAFKLLGTEPPSQGAVQRHRTRRCRCP